MIRLFSKYGANLCHSKIFASTSETVRYVRNSNLKTITCDGITSISSEPDNDDAGRVNAGNDDHETPETRRESDVVAVVAESRQTRQRIVDGNNNNDEYDDSSFVEPELDEKAHF